MSIITLFLLFSMLAVLWSDVRTYTIPNPLVAALLVLYPVALYVSPNAVDWQRALLAAGIVFILGYVVFLMKWMGAGDIKLIVACALWVGMEHLLDFIFIVTAIGGVFSLFLWIFRKIEPRLPWERKRALPRILREGEPVPYGVAIAFGFLLMMYWKEVPLLG